MHGLNILLVSRLTVVYAPPVLSIGVVSIRFTAVAAADGRGQI